MTVDATLVRALLIALVTAAVAPLLVRTLRRDALWIASFPAAVAFYGPSFAGFALVSGLGFVGACGIGAIANRSRRWRVTAIALGALVLLFTAGRLAHWERPILFFPDRPPLVIWILDMWLVLRLVTLYWEVGSGMVAVPSIGAYAGWVALPFTLAGPLVRYSEMPATLEMRAAQWRSRRWWTEAGLAAAKMFLGISVGRMADVVPEPHLLHGLVLVFISGPLGFYLTFAGCFHLMQVFARPVGIAIPDSFNWPLGRENISAFWASWNMTATRVFRDYLFYNRWGLRRHNMYLNTIALFGLVGLWHGANPYWVLWGLLHGVMFCVFLAWRRWKAARGRRGEPAPWTPADAAGRLATYMCICAAWYLPSKILQWLGVI